MKAFITGSVTYGTPTAESDIDLCVLVSSDDLDTLLSVIGDPSANTVKYGAKAASVRFGELNLICFTDAREMAAWLVATEELKTRKPVERHEAVTLIKRLVAENMTMETLA